MLEIFHSIKNFFVDSTRAVGQAVSGVVDSARYKLDELDNRARRRDAVAELGEKVFGMYQAGVEMPADAEPLLSELRGLEEGLQSMKTELAEKRANNKTREAELREALKETRAQGRQLRDEKRAAARQAKEEARAAALQAKEEARIAAEVAAAEADEQPLVEEVLEPQLVMDMPTYEALEQDAPAEPVEAAEVPEIDVASEETKEDEPILM